MLTKMTRYGFVLGKPIFRSIKRILQNKFMYIKQYDQRRSNQIN